MEFEYGLSISELRKRTSKERMRIVRLLSDKSKEYLSLSDNDKLVFNHLVKAAKWIDIIHYKLDNSHNLDFLNFLEKEITKCSEKAKLTKILFLAQEGMFSPDYEGNQISLVKNLKQPLGLNFYPEDLSIDEFHNILNKMLDKNMIDEIKKILSQRSVVRREGNLLKGIDYIEYFDEFKEVSKELMLASDYVSDNENDFKDFLILQANALNKVDNNLDALADKKWAEISNSKFEFTITRESYDDKFTSTIFENTGIMQRLNSYGIEPLYKDCIGCRVGIVNREGTNKLNNLKLLINIAKRHIPYDIYNINVDNIIGDIDNDKKISQIATDVDLIALTGNEGAFRAGIVIAQNLPNDDKLSLKIGGGRKNVYHRQVRKLSDKKIVNAVLDKQFTKYYSDEAFHYATICHENTHTLGPDCKGLGKYSSIIEEFKADMGMFAFLNEFVYENIFTEVQAKQIIVTEIVNSFLKAKPTLEQAHRVRSVMIINRFFKVGAVWLEKKKIYIDFQKVIETSKIMMKEVIDLQVNRSIVDTEKYINKYFKWTKELATIAEIKRKNSLKLNGMLISPLVDSIKIQEL